MVVDPHIGDFQLAERIVEALELIAIAIIVAAVVFALVGTLVDTFRSDEKMIYHRVYKVFRRHMTPGLLIGLDVLIAADIVSSVTLERTLESIAGLGLLVLIRTFLSWTLEVEIEGRWPWETRREDR